MKTQKVMMDGKEIEIILELSAEEKDDTILIDNIDSDDLLEDTLDLEEILGNTKRLNDELENTRKINVGEVNEH